jgi:uncharacterized protein (TIGR03086 family)
MKIDVLEAADAQLVRIVGSVPSTAWNNPTPIEISVREVVDHVAAGTIFATRLLAGASATAAVAGLDTDHLGDDPVRALTTSGEAQRAAFEGADRALVLHHPSGDISYETFLRFRLGDLVIHAWDIATGAGLDTSLDAPLVDALWAMVEPHLDEMRTRGAFGSGASDDLPPDTSPQARLLDAFGRRPLG